MGTIITDEDVKDVASNKRALRGRPDKLVVHVTALIDQMTVLLEYIDTILQNG